MSGFFFVNKSKLHIMGLFFSATIRTTEAIPRVLPAAEIWGFLESRIPSSLRGRSPKQSSNYQPFLDCFTSLPMTKV
jgi:hypothetical protein